MSKQKSIKAVAINTSIFEYVENQPVTLSDCFFDLNNQKFNSGRVHLLFFFFFLAFYFLYVTDSQSLTGGPPHSTKGCCSPGKIF